MTDIAALYERESAGAGAGDGAGDGAAAEAREPIAAVVALHLCGAASDLAIELALARRAPFALSPCCLGKALATRDPARRPPPRRAAGAPLRPAALLDSRSRDAAPEAGMYPRSQWLRRALAADGADAAAGHALLAAAADYGVALGAGDGSAGRTPEAERARVALQRHAKAVVELDRLERAREAGYAVRLLELPRLGATYPKRELLLGAPRGSRAAEAIAALRTLPSPVG